MSDPRSSADHRRPMVVADIQVWWHVLFGVVIADDGEWKLVSVGDVILRSDDKDWYDVTTGRKWNVRTQNRDLPTFHLFLTLGGVGLSAETVFPLECITLGLGLIFSPSALREHLYPSYNGSDDAGVNYK